MSTPNSSNALRILIASALLSSTIVLADTPSAVDSKNRAALELPGATLSISPSAGEKVAKVIVKLAISNASPSIPPWDYSIQYVLVDLSTGLEVANDSITIYGRAEENAYESVNEHHLETDAGTVLSVKAVNTSDSASVPDSGIGLSLSAIHQTNWSIFQTNHQPIIELDSTINGRPQVVIKVPVAGALEYDVEWVFIDKDDNFGPGTGSAPFSWKDPVRVTTNNLRYGLDGTFPDGVLHVRARAVSRYSNSVTTRRLGVWSQVVSATTSTLNSNAPFEVLKNWHLRQSYLEGPRRQRTLTYFDGTLRNRQTQTASESTGARLVGETKYDLEGRPAANFLPVPEAGWGLNYLPLFNVVDNGTGTVTYFGPELVGATTTPPTSPTNGAEKYYSAHNPASDDLTPFIAKANGYPYAVTEFTRDDSGRVRAQSGVGSQLKLGSHDKRNIYGEPNQTQLQNMFGSNVGNAKNYKRNIVIDQNGQASVLYEDPAGHTIAGGLVGVSPPSLVSITPAFPRTTASLSELNVIDVDRGLSTLQAAVANQDANTAYHFTYNVTGVDYKAASTAAGLSELCATCTYKLSIHITDPHGAPVPLRVGSTADNDPNCNCAVLADGNTACTGEVNSIERNIDNLAPKACTAEFPIGTEGFSIPPVLFCAVMQEPGEYLVSKTLEITSADASGQVVAPYCEPIATRDPISYYGPPSDPAYCSRDCSKFCQEAEAQSPGTFEQCLKSCSHPESWAIQEGTQATCEALEASIQTDISPGGWLYEENQANGLPVPTLSDHPESCHIDKCGELQASNIYDLSMGAVNTYDEALCQGYLNPLTMSLTAAGPPTPTSATGCHSNPDPYFGSGGVGASSKASVRSKLINYSQAIGWSGDLTLWQFVASAADNKDDQWRLFRSIYLGLKQAAHVAYMEDPDRGHCPYYDSPRAHVQRPLIFESGYEAIDAVASSTEEYCTNLCPARVSQWMFELQQACFLPVLPPGLDTALAQYCSSTCGIANPLPVITTEAIASNNSDLMAAQALLGEWCNVGDIAVNDPIRRQTLCQVTCCVEWEMSKCGGTLSQFLQGLFPVRVGDAIPVRGNGSPFLTIKGCFDYAEKMKVESQDIAVLAGTKIACRLEFRDSTGKIVNPEEIENISSFEYEADAHGISSGLPFTKISFYAKLKGRDPLRIYLFSDCAFDKWTKIEKQCEDSTLPLCPAWTRELDVPVNGSSDKTDEGIEELCINDGTPTSSAGGPTKQTSSLSQNKSRLLSMLSNGESQTNRSVQGERDCIGCFEELQTIFRDVVGHAATASNTYKDFGCFTKAKEIRQGQYIISTTKSECIVEFRSADGRPRSLRELKAIQGTVVTDPPPFSSSVSLLFSGIVLKGVDASNAPLDLFMFSDCKNVVKCPPLPNARNCSIKTRPGACIREITRTIADDLPVSSNGALPIPEGSCFDVVTYTNLGGAVFHKKGGKKDDICAIGLFIPGRSLNISSLEKIYGVFASARPTGLSDSIAGLLYTGYAVHIEYAPSPFGSSANSPISKPKIAYIYSKCAFGSEKACDQVPIDVVLPDVPIPTNNICEDAQNEQAWQHGIILRSNDLISCQNQTLSDHLNKCFASPFSETFTYSYDNRESNLVLYHFDQANNLVTHVPPEGVDTTSGHAEHRMQSRYKYNSLNQVLWQETPDGGDRNFWYNDLGQLRFSQDSLQAVSGQHSYIKYDAKSRITEVGVVEGLSDGDIKDNWNNPSFPAQADFGLTEVTQTFYDTLDGTPSECAAINVDNSRDRVVAVVAKSNNASDNVITCYGMDIHGNVSTLIQKIPGLGPKKLEYEYDLVSGKILATHFQAAQADAFHQRYTFDDDERIALIETSRDGVLWDEDVRYRFYAHGPLAKVTLGQDRVQNLDLTYTLSSWPKGLNSTTGDPSRDPGRDGLADSTGHITPPDVLSYSLDYFPGDYEPIGPRNNPHASITWNDTAGATVPSAFARQSCVGAFKSSGDGCGLFDGNITNATYALLPFSNSTSVALGTSYQYDQLYRLRTAVGGLGLTAPADKWPEAAAFSSLYAETLTYDLNSNILTLKRFAPDPGNAASSLAMDDLTYQYERDASGHLTSNRLLHIGDTVSSNLFTQDLDDQGTFAQLDPNYAFDLRGNLIRDRAEHLDPILWSSQGKVIGANKGNESFQYIFDGLGNRVAKVTKRGPTEVDWDYEFLVRDARGGLLTVYTKTYTEVDGQLVPHVVLQEFVISGEGRIGVLK